MKKLVSILTLCSLLFLGACKTQTLTPQQKAQKAAKAKVEMVQDEAANLKKITNGNFIFYPTTVEPEFGTTHLLNCDCFLQVDQNSLTVQLPFLGHFFLSPIPFGLSPLNFMSADINYSYSTEDEDGVIYKVIIVPQDAVSAMDQGLTFNMQLNIQTGNATVLITSDNTNPITYTGYYQ